MSKKGTTDQDGSGKPKSGKVKLILGAVALLGLGAGGAYGAVAAGLVGSHDGENTGPDVPQLVGKDEADPYSADSGEGEGAEVVHGEGGSEYRTLYYSFEEGFTSNLRDSPGLVQVNIAASTRYDGRVIQWLQQEAAALECRWAEEEGVWHFM